MQQCSPTAALGAFADDEAENVARILGRMLGEKCCGALGCQSACDADPEGPLSTSTSTAQGGTTFPRPRRSYSRCKVADRDSLKRISLEEKCSEEAEKITSRSSIAR